MATRHGDDDLELRAPDRLADEDTPPIEEPPLVRRDCRKRLTEWDEYVGAAGTLYLGMAISICADLLLAVNDLLQPGQADVVKRLHDDVQALGLPGYL